ncbi:hypothetical protein H310_00083 [Aphanomyces invadans]|uniref:Secreted protein n=1 Tax=Aphanomyces invadans TaxID=157072 RepID=A0A024USM5_9STRA|nr:hypothetical protein H310_00083 [Aphanomyces invadans]ETW09521.1 hypothetical protein H310_00083 [Aphanomyces invadans]|eukprot:XP_008860932.1 hypothetical protein H310_00083 [Aphanomyces invadans]
MALLVQVVHFMFGPSFTAVTIRVKDGLIVCDPHNYWLVCIVGGGVPQPPCLDLCRRRTSNYAASLIVSLLRMSFTAAVVLNTEFTPPNRLCSIDTSNFGLEFSGEVPVDVTMWFFFQVIT